MAETMRPRVIYGFGEVMIRLSPVGQQTFGESNTIQLTAGGSEANVLAKLGSFSRLFQGELVTAINDDLAGRAIVSELQKHRVGLRGVRWTRNGRNGLYYLEQGMGPIVARVDYDRAGSAIALLEPDESLFTGLSKASALFISGITPALSANCAKNTEYALRKAQELRVPVFFDVNYRKKLWSAAEARARLDSFLRDGCITCLITTETDARTVFGIDCGVDDESPIEILIERSRKVLEALKKLYSDKCELYVLTIRKRITNETGVWTSAALLPDGSYIVGDVFDYVVLDRPGAGDACSAGLVAGYLGIQRDGSLKDGVDLSTRVKMGLDLGNRAAIVAQKTFGDLGPAWDAAMYFDRVSESKEIAR
ncbi:MAG TPA: sugar kinase [Phycisphaerae bacterium]|nr:sugar kinase [Phycisphaerae bacterium]HOB74658.1 sugar kinase [Phycisphaerae bacterium]HOJ53629.1 sugar kinase [Phycisphaerae bacterium]HOL26354.1 sugar kinase [Phycisphaerae bacterium]HPP21137.1 sugar kinase [Phycisphaerae bacterium]